MLGADVLLKLLDPPLYAYGLTRLPKNKSIKPGKKVDADPTTIKAEVTEALVAKHLKSADDSIGLLFVHKAENTARYMVIDVDDYTDSIALRQELNQKIKRYRLPLIYVRSKSGGAHLYRIYAERVPAKQAQNDGRLYAHILGLEPGIEVFPKQTTVTGDKLGNWINWPYAGAAQGDHSRIAYTSDDQALPDVRAFIEYVREVEVKYGIDQVDLYRGAPPCLIKLMAQGVPEGGRNEALFQYGTYLQRRDGEVDRDNLDAGNRGLNSPDPLPGSEVTQVEKSLEKREYAYVCTRGPQAAEGICNRTLCLDQDYGIGQIAADHSPDAVLLPGHQFTGRDAAAKIYARLADSVYLRANRVSRISPDGTVSIIKGQEFRSVVERLGPTYTRVKVKGDRDGKTHDHRALISLDNANQVLDAENKTEYLGAVNLVSPIPLLLPDGEIMRPGLNAGGVFVTDDLDVPMLKTSDALAILDRLLFDFDFPTPGDKARALAMIITPALRFSGLLDGPVPMDIGEADQSQAGKTLRQAMTRHLYGATRVPLIARAAKGGVGSLDETLLDHYFKAHPFTAIDNVRGKIDSQVLEAALTSPDGIVKGRLPFIGNVTLDVSRVFHQLTSNAAEMTKDLGNRACIVRIRKRPPGYKYQDITPLKTIDANRGELLGAVYSIVLDWLDHGRPGIPVVHDMAAWASSLGWILDRLGYQDFLAGHEVIKKRTASPFMSWLRQVVAEMQGGAEYAAAELLELSDNLGLDLPFKAGEYASRTLGIKLAALYSDDGAIDVDGVPLTRETRTYDKVSDDGKVSGQGQVKLYSKPYDDETPY